MQLKDVLTIAISSLALAVSVGTLAYTVFVKPRIDLRQSRLSVLQSSEIEALSAARLALMIVSRHIFDVTGVLEWPDLLNSEDWQKARHAMDAMMDRGAAIKSSSEQLLRSSLAGLRMELDLYGQSVATLAQQLKTIETYEGNMDPQERRTRYQEAVRRLSYRHAVLYAKSLELAQRSGSALMTGNDDPTITVPVEYD